MALNSQHHLFFVDKVEEIDLCGSTVFQITGGEYCKPTDFKRLNYEKHNLGNCEQCKKSYAETLASMEERFKAFPYCCALHSKLVKVDWFDRKHFDDTPKLFSDKLFYTWHHILNFIETDEWKNECIDFIEYIFETFGSFPPTYGEPLFFKDFATRITELVSKLDVFKERKEIILEFITNYRNPTKSQTDWNILMEVYNEWYKTFPFELTFLANLKQYFSKNIPLVQGMHTNKYLGLTKASLRTKDSLVNSLIKTTEEIITQVNIATLYENGLVNDLEKVKLELQFQKRKQKLKEGYSNNSNNSDTRYRKILKQWLKDEIEFIKEIEPTIRNINKPKENLFNDLIMACCKMIENKIFWEADENTRTKQVLDLLSSNYFTKDQATYGKSEKGKKSGSVDGVIIDKSLTEYFIEAFNLNSISKESIQRHVNKLESNYDSKGLLNKYLLVYCNVDDNKFSPFCINYLNFIDSTLQFKFEKIELTEIATTYTNIKVLKTIHLREDRFVTLYHILLKMPYKPET